MRTNKVILIAGTRGTGKTDYSKNLLAKMENIFPKCLVVDTFDNPVWQDLSTHDHPDRLKNVHILQPGQLPRWKKGTARIFSSNTGMLMEQIQLHCRNTFLIFEDATRYIGSKLTTDVNNFVLDSKQKNLDIVFVFHSLMQIPPDLVRISDVLVLFKTNEGVPPKTKYPWGEIPQMMAELKRSSNRFVNKILLLN